MSQQSAPATPELVSSASPSTPNQLSCPRTPSTPRRSSSSSVLMTPRTPLTPSPLTSGSVRNRGPKSKMLRFAPPMVPFRLDKEAKRAVLRASHRLREATSEEEDDDDFFAPTASLKKEFTTQPATFVPMARCHSDPVSGSSRRHGLKRETQSLHFGIPRSPRMRDLASCA